jgi:uncharacterized protein YqcC (DUF446 family)
MGARDNLKFIKYGELTDKQREDLKKTLKQRQQEIQAALKQVNLVETRRPKRPKKKSSERFEAREPVAPHNLQWVSYSPSSHAMPVRDKMAALRDQLEHVQAQLDEIRRAFVEIIPKL